MTLRAKPLPAGSFVLELSDNICVAVVHIVGLYTTTRNEVCARLSNGENVIVAKCESAQEARTDYAAAMVILDNAYKEVNA